MEEWRRHEERVEFASRGTSEPSESILRGGQEADGLPPKVEVVWKRIGDEGLDTADRGDEASWRQLREVLRIHAVTRYVKKLSDPPRYERKTQ